MATISFVACAKSKRSRPTSAGLIYDSSLFRKSLLYCLSRSDDVYILSAKYGVLNLGTKLSRTN
jgi:hypothetical protein